MAMMGLVAMMIMNDDITDKAEDQKKNRKRNLEEKNKKLCKNHNNRVKKQEKDHAEKR